MNKNISKEIFSEIGQVINNNVDDLQNEREKERDTILLQMDNL